MAKTKRMMETDEKTGVQRQFFPITHASAVLGLEEIIAGEATVLSVNGKIGAVVITKEDLGLENVLTELPYASEEDDGIITSEMYQKILNSGEGGGVSQEYVDQKMSEAYQNAQAYTDSKIPNVSFEKVGEV